MNAPAHRPMNTKPPSARGLWKAQDRHARMHRSSELPEAIVRRLGIWRPPAWTFAVWMLEVRRERLRELFADARAPSLTGTRRRTAMKYFGAVVAELRSYRLQAVAAGWRLP
jgi:hypothetical protein